MPTVPAASDCGAFTHRLKQQAFELGFDAVGVTRLSPSDHAAAYRAWLEAGYHGEMAYMARADAVARRLHPERAWPEVRSALVVALGYAGVGDDLVQPDQPDRGTIARYARGRDYHRLIRTGLLSLLSWIESEIDETLPAARAYVDTGPLLERELARRAGLGWFGRNTMLIHPRRGSYFFLGTLLLELDLEPDPPFEADRCGRCTACVDACPTGALLGRDDAGAPIMDAKRCISYLTIELRGAIPRELRPLIGNRVFGCDICQEVCPFTRKFTPPASHPDFAARAAGELPRGVQPAAFAAHHPGTASPALVELMSLDEAAWDSFSRGSALRRAGRAGFLRNVAVALGNWGSPEALPALAAALADSEPLVRSHAAWALGEIASPGSVDTLHSALATEPDSSVRAEIEHALTAIAQNSKRQERGA